MRARLIPAVAAVAVGGALALPAHSAPVPTASYIVTLLPSASPSLVATLTKPLGGQVGFLYTHALNGFSVTLPSAAVPALRLLPGVAAVQRDQVVHATTSTTPPSYGLDRIDQRALPLNSTYTYTADAHNVTAYVIDTGIQYSHQEFEGRATFGRDTVSPSTGGVDCNGHGTHVSGTIGGKTYGVAKKVNLVAVRVLGCDGSGATSGVVAGIDWVIAHHQAGAPAVANMSLGGGADTATDTAVSNAIADGITFAVAAGNDGGGLNDLLGLSDACGGSPSRVPAAITVAATDSTDTRASYSNKGKCVDIWAPGTNIKSSWMGANNASNTISGTSMATPHVTGVAALYLSGHPTAAPSTVAGQLVGNGTKGVVKSPGSGSPNVLLYTSY